MRGLIAAAALPFAAPTAESAAITQPAQAPQADAILQQGTALARWSQTQIRARGSLAPTRRKARCRPRRETPVRSDTLFIAQFADGRRIAGKITVSAVAKPAIRACRVGPPPADPAAHCQPTERRP
ncbi:hypothetical protein [Tahibacter caeni]|uniref:hypothetical protein n=1 Tax=Tahibacter caeni TaxID=1453545 RepID=UPI002148C80F|nr:hypothetical protein [Tahibacter caeni]